MVVRGEAGIGKTALLDYLAERAGDARVVRAAGVEAELELPFATLQQLCMPLLDGAAQLPAPQRDALETALGVGAGPRPDPFLVGLAVLTLLSNAAETEPGPGFATVIFTTPAVLAVPVAVSEVDEL